MVRNGDATSESVSILLVEDNPAEARLIGEVLKGTAFARAEVCHVPRLQEACQYLRDCSRCDVALLDLTLPDSVGLSSVSSLATEQPNLPIVVLTHHNDEKLALNAVRHGAQDFLVKRHLNADNLVRSLRYAIERKQTEEALREAKTSLEQRVQVRTQELEQANALLREQITARQQVQDRLKLAQQAAKIGTFEWFLEPSTVVWSPEIEALYGRTPGSFGAQVYPWLAAVHSEDRDRIWNELQRIQTAGQSLSLEFRARYPDGEIRWIALKGKLFADEAGKPSRFLGIHLDITEKKNLETQFLRAQRLESLGVLASGIAHDLNNVLTPILGATQLMRLKMDATPDNDRMLDILESSARRGADLIKQILSFARGTEGKKLTLQLNHLALESRRLVGQTVGNNIEILADLGSDLWTVTGDATQLHQVAMNLCVNARDAMPEGGRLTIQTFNIAASEEFAATHLEARTNSSYVAVRVSDTGIGIAPENLDKIFDPFFTTKPLGKGTGLGLSAVVGIVRSHGGFLEVTSQVGQGSEFTVYLPAKPSAIAKSEQTPVQPIGQGECILVVDDEPLIRDVLQTLLESQQYRVLVAENGLDAIATYQAHPEVAVVLMDLGMPVMDGTTSWELLQRIDPEAKGIAMSGLASGRMVAAEAGFSGFMQKPVTLEVLLSQVQGLLEG
ncbi:MAG: response regulator [Cyanobacteria bacterium P01_H01_bin.15]